MLAADLFHNFQVTWVQAEWRTIMVYISMYKSDSNGTALKISIHYLSIKI